MARTAVTVDDLSVSAAIAGTGVNIDTTNNHSITTDYPGDVVVLVDHTGSTDGVLTVKAGTNPPAFRAGVGDLAITCVAGETRYFMIESARFMQSDGTIHLDAATFDAGKIFAFRVPRGV